MFIGTYEIKVIEEKDGKVYFENLGLDAKEEKDEIIYSLPKGTFDLVTSEEKIEPENEREIQKATVSDYIVSIITEEMFKSLIKSGVMLVQAEQIIRRLSLKIEQTKAEVLKKAANHEGHEQTIPLDDLIYYLGND